MSQVGKRLVYQNAKNAVQRAGLSAGKAVLSQSYLRTEAALSTSTALYQMNVLVNEQYQAAFVTNNLLNLQDAFVVSEVGIFLATAASSSTTETNVKLYTYPSPTVFTGTGVQAGCYDIYNGNMSLSVNQRTILPYWDVQRHMFIPQTQLTAATNSPIDQYEGNHAGYYPAEPNIVLVGSKKNILQIQLDAAPSGIVANSRLVIIFRGILMQNVTPVN